MSEHIELSRNHFVAVGLAWGAALLIVLAAAAAASADMQLKESHVTLSGTGIFVNGDDNQFRQRQGVPNDFLGGIEDLHMEWGLGDGANMQLDGRGMFDNGDYLARLRVEKSDKGYVTAGYRQFRTYYDGTGGFFPQNNLIISYFDENLKLDRGEAWLEAGLRLPNVPKITARYAHLFRDGQKSSTEWADTALTGPFGLRNIVPALWTINERRDIVSLDMAHQIRTTDVGAGFLYESSDIDNQKSAERRPGEPGIERFFTQKDKATTDVVDAHAFTSTPFADNRIIVSSSYAYGSVDNNLGGSRIYGAGFDPAYDPNFANRQPFDEGFLDLGGSTRIHENIGTFSVQGRPTKNFHLTGGFRAEREDLEGNSSFTETNVGNPPTFTSTQDPLHAHSETDNTRLSESADARYTGIANWVFYAEGEWTQEDADLFERELDLGAGTVALDRLTDMYIQRQKYGAGLTWYPLKNVNFSARYTYKTDDYDFNHHIDSTPATGGDRFPAFITRQEVSTHAADFRLTWSVLASLRATARYDIAYSEFDQKSELLAEVRSANIHRHAVGGNLTWSPTAASYVQADVNYVISQTNTPANELTGAAQGVVVDFDNDYWTASLTSGIALDQKTDLQGRYFYFRADNYDNNSLFSQPYGLTATEHGVSVAVTRQLTEKMRARLAYGYFTNDEKLAGGANDYHASAVTGTLEVTF